MGRVKPVREFRKVNEIVTAPCVAKTVGCHQATAWRRCEIWANDYSLDLDWLFRPIDQNASNRIKSHFDEARRVNQMIPNRASESKISEQEKALYVKKKINFEKLDADYNKAVKKHYGIENVTERPFDAIRREVRERIKIENNELTNNVRLKRELNKRDYLLAGTR